MATVKVIEDRLKKLLDYEGPIGIAIKGEWGVGKTYFWKDFSENEISDKKVVYISLFGKSSVKEIKEDVIVQTLEFYKKLKGIMSHIKQINLNLPLVSLDISLESILSLLKPRDLNNLIVCFDDFERISPKLEIKEIFGFISYLKENFMCKVVLIVNEESLKRDKENGEEKNQGKNKQEDFIKVYDEYKEKIIDYELSFAPTVEENFNIMENHLLLDIAKDELLSFLKKFKINNLRIIRQLILVLNDFAFVDNLEIDDGVKKEFFQKLIRLAFIKIKFNFTNFEELKTYRFSKMLSNKEERKENKEYEEKLRYLDDLPFVFSSDNRDLKIITDYLKDSVTDDKKLSEILTDINQKSRLRTKSNEFENFFDKLRFDFNYTFEEFKSDIKDFLEKNKGDIIYIVGFADLGYYLSYLIELDPENKDYYINYGEKVTEDFLNKQNAYEIIKDPQSTSISMKHYPEELRKFIENKIQSIKKSVLKNGMKKDILRQKMKEMRITSSMDPLDKDLLNMTPKDKYKEFMLEDMEFTREAIHFYQFVKNWDLFQDFKHKIKEILDELEKDEKYKIKIKEIKNMIGLNNVQ